MQFIQIANGKEIDMTSIILKQMSGEITRDKILKIIKENNEKK